MIWSVIGQVAGLGRAGVADREGEPGGRASATWTIPAASAGLMVVPWRSKPKGRGPPALHCPASAWWRRVAATRRAASRDALFATAHIIRPGGCRHQWPAA